MRRTRSPDLNKTSNQNRERSHDKFGSHHQNHTQPTNMLKHPMQFVFSTPKTQLTQFLTSPSVQRIQNQPKFISSSFSSQADRWDPDYHTHKLAHFSRVPLFVFQITSESSASKMFISTIFLGRLNVDKQIDAWFRYQAEPLNFAHTEADISTWLDFSQITFALKQPTCRSAIFMASCVGNWHTWYNLKQNDVMSSTAKIRLKLQVRCTTQENQRSWATPSECTQCI